MSLAPVFLNFILYRNNLVGSRELVSRMICPASVAPGGRDEEGELSQPGRKVSSDHLWLKIRTSGGEPPSAVAWADVPAAAAMTISISLVIFITPRLRTVLCVLISAPS